MNLDYIEWQNFGCYGNKKQRLDFTDTSSFNLIKAKNGYGKSTIRRIIEYAIYGKVSGLHKKDLVNRINQKGLVTTTEFTINGKPIYLKQGYKPDIFKAIINNVPADNLPSHTRKYLESEVYPLPHSVFSNVVSFSVKDFKSFLSLRADEKRKIPDKLFGTSIINTINEKLKKEASVINTKASNLITLINNKRKEIKQLEYQLSKHRDSKVGVEETQNIRENLNKIRKVLKQLHFKIQKTQTSSNEFQTKIYKLEAEKNQIVKQLNVLNQHDDCPVCSTPLNDDKVVDLKEELQKRLDEHLTKLSNLYSLNDITLKELNKYNKYLNTLTNKEQELKYKLDNNLDVNAIEVNNLLLLTTTYEKSLFDLEKEYETLKEDIEYYKEALAIFSNDGIKRELNKTIIKPLNKIVYRNSRQLGLEHFIKFDEDFNTEVKHLGQVINHKTMSDGELNKANLVIVLAFIELVKLRFPSFNVMFLDEVFTSLDDENIHLILGMLKAIVQKYKFNCFIVTHYPIDEHFFDKIIKINKKNGFSRVQYKK